MEEESRIRWLDAARGYGILLVIFAHVDYSFLRGIIYTFHMPLFFFLSGYVFEREDQKNSCAILLSGDSHADL